MITEFFVGFAIGLLDFVVGWLPDETAVAFPDLGPLFGAMHTLDYATGGFVSASFDAFVVVLGVMFVLFLYAVIRQVFSHAPLVGGR